MLNRLQSRVPWRWRLVLVALAVAAILYLHLVASLEVGSLAYWVVAAVLFAVALGAGFRAWLLTIVLVGVALVGKVYLLPPPSLAWDAAETVALPAILMDDPAAPGLAQLRAEYRLDDLVRDAGSDRERVARLTAWANSRFGHSGSNQPSHPDPLTILREGAAGKSFRCVEYSVVLAAAARSLGLPSRVVGLKRQDVETARFGGGHVVAEVWLRDERRWALADGQWNALLELDGRLLDAVAVRQALAERAPGLRVVTTGGWPLQDRLYLSWLAPYLYYFDYNLDQRFFVGESRQPGRVMLVPLGAPEPRVFARVHPVGECAYVHNPALFYRPPE